MVKIQDLIKISDFEWEIPQTFRQDMRVPVRLFATRRLLEAVMDDQSLEQAVNSATLPGLVGHVIVMPDMHQGYGFPIGGVAATRYPEGVISPGAIGYDINCLSGDSEIMHEFGYFRKIEDMQDCRDLSLVCFNFERMERENASPLLWFSKKPDRQVYKMVTEGGAEITATGDHPFWTKDGMVMLEELEVGEQVALHPFQGIPYEKPGDKVILSEEMLEDRLQEMGKGERGNAAQQIIHSLKTRNLIPLTLASEAVPILCKLLGFLFGDGNVRFDRKTGKGFVSFYGKKEDLDDIRRDIKRLGYKSSQVWNRTRSHTINTTYATYQFERTEHWISINSTSLAILFSFIGAPVGNKTKQDSHAPEWLEDAPLWQKRLFLAGLFGAELSAPKTVTGHPCNFAAPVLSMNKRQEFGNSGAAFLETIARWLSDFGIEVRPIGRRLEQLNIDGSQSLRLRLIISAFPENLRLLWGTIGFEYNRSRTASAAAALQYLALKETWIETRTSIAQEARMMSTSGISPTQIYAHFSGQGVNQRFIERSIYGGRKSSPRIGAVFPSFESFRQEYTEGLADSGMVWDRIACIEPAEDPGLVYDFTMDHDHHNFIANRFVVSNCGVRLLGSSIDLEEAEDKLDLLATALNEHCPSGVGVKGALRVTQNELDKVCVEGARWALSQGYATEQDLRRTEEEGRLEGADPSKVSPRAKERGRPQLGTLGAGNHFIEVDVVDQVFDAEAAQAMGLRRGSLAVLIHSGSRGFGHQICSDYVKEFQGAIKKYNIKLPDRELVCAPLDSPEGQAYLAAMRCAANYAFTNRQVLAYHARRAFEDVFEGKVTNWNLHQVYDIAHNMGKIETHEVDGKKMKVCVHRKGATRAFGPGAPGLPPEYEKTGQPVLVPGSMGTASWVLVGTETSMKSSLGSTCHGAGRVMSRAKAKKEVRGDSLRKELEAQGVHIRAGSMAGLAEEAPAAYKDVDAVVETVSGAKIAKKVARLRPVVVIKG
jgi:tRNA-splicing ligase RtcB (3'-phosphate/5'-hydroxy nucleic acid ligase)